MDNVHVTEKTSEIRMSHCRVCEHYFSMTKMCMLCSCFMPLKVHLKEAKCPDKRWGWGPGNRSKK